MTYPKPEQWRTWPHEKQIQFLEDRIATEQRTSLRIAEHWLSAAARVRELEAEVKP